MRWPLIVAWAAAAVCLQPDPAALAAGCPGSNGLGHLLAGQGWLSSTKKGEKRPASPKQAPPSPVDIGVSPSGHYVTYKGETLMLVGESGTQCVPQNININYRQWIDDCAARGIRAVHVWSFVAARQKQDGSVMEDRYGYVYPLATPWARKTAGPNAADQLKQWDLKTFDDGPDGDFTHYWPRMRDMCSYAKSKKMLVGVTVFFGWPKWNTSKRPAWSYHPLNVVNGGPVTDPDNHVTKAQLIDTPGTEVWMQEWSDAWPVRRKTQWIWERFSKKLIDDLNPCGNVFFVFMDEHSYSEGNCGDHFLKFFKSRGAVWVDWDKRRADVTFVFGATHRADKNPTALSGFNGRPARPFLLLEGQPYSGDGLRTSIWTFSLGGGHYFLHADEDEKNDRLGIMGYDPHVPGGDKGMYKRDWLGHASRFFNQQVIDLDNMVPHNRLAGSGTCCLADPGREYVVYSKIDAPVTFSLDLSAAAGKTLNCRFYDPRKGRFGAAFQRKGGGTESFTKPDSADWVLHVAADGS